MAWIAPIAAAAKRQEEEREERAKLQALRGQDPEGLYEFKVLRSLGFGFGGDERRQAILDQEALAGWALLEALDGARLILRRDASRRALDAQLPPGVDPYRSEVGGKRGVAALVVGLSLIVGLAVYLAVSTLSEGSIAGGIIAVAVVLVAIGVAAAALAIRARR